MRLTDCFSGLVAYVTYFQKSSAKKQVAFDQVKSDIQRLLSEGEETMRTNNFSPDEYDQARFAICAWVDEVILDSAWQEKIQWQKELLQRLYYNTTDAGKEFYTRLNNLAFQSTDVREVYYLCLAMGFKGQYCHDGDEFLLEQLKTSNLKILTGSSLGIPSLERSELFPDAFPHPTEATNVSPKRFRLSPFTLLFMGGPIVLYGLLFIIYYFILNNIGDSFLSTPL